MTARSHSTILSAVSLLLGGCVSIGEDPPPALLTLTPDAQIEAGAGPSARSHRCADRPVRSDQGA